VAAAIRHCHTNYDELLAAGLDRAMARQRVRNRVEDVLEVWGPDPEGTPSGIPDAAAAE
jgi:hypothetical protein